MLMRRANLACCYEKRNGVDVDLWVRHLINWFLHTLLNQTQFMHKIDVARRCFQSMAMVLLSMGMKQSKWYTRAAKAGYVTAHYNLGICYLQGKGVAAVDKNEVIKWLILCGRKGDTDAHDLLNELQYLYFFAFLCRLCVTSYYSMAMHTRSKVHCQSVPFWNP